MLAATRELKRDADGKLVPMIALRDLRAQLPLADAAVKACIERSGKRPTGKATLSFTVAAKNNQLVLDTTGVQDDETLSGVPEVLECMHKTAKVLLPDMYPVPELGTAIYVRRQVRIEDGVLVEDSLPSFSYNP
jgi:Xaa-Pro aminopeptidase